MYFVGWYILPKNIFINLLPRGRIEKGECVLVNSSIISTTAFGI